MNIIKRFYVHILTVTAMMVALSMTAGPAVAGLFDFTQGKVAAPGTELHALGTQAIESGLGGISYFTDGEGRVVKVQAKEMGNGELRVSTDQAQIPQDYIAGSQSQTREAERTLNSLEELANQQPWVGGYAVLPHNEGVEAYKLGVTVESELQRRDLGAYHDNRTECCWGL
jgi:hypothetical protein